MSAPRGVVSIIVSDARERRRISRLVQTWGYTVETHAAIAEWTARITNPVFMRVGGTGSIRLPRRAEDSLALPPQTHEKGGKSSSPGCALVQVLPGAANISDITTSFKTSGVPYILLDPSPDLRACVRAVKGGAFDYFALPPDPEELRQSIQEALTRPGGQPPAEALSPSLIARAEGLTPRQREVFRLAAAGMPNKQIAAELGISEKTVKIHRFFVMNKLQTSSIAELARVAEKLKLGD